MLDEKTSEEVVVRMTAMDYEEGWYEGDFSRMERCLHPNLVKRAIKRDPTTGEKYLRDLTKGDMVQLVKDGGGTDIPRDLIYYKVDIWEIHNEVAFVRAESYSSIDYLQLVKDDKWLILNILYTTDHANARPK